MRVLLAIWMIFSVSGTALASAVTEIFLARYQAEQMAADQPFSDVVVRPVPDDPGKGDVWFAGRTSLWRWQPAGQSVRRYRLLENAAPGSNKPIVDSSYLTGGSMNVDGLHRILVEPSSGAILVSSTDGMYEVDPANGRILHYPLPVNVKPVTTGLFGIGDHIVWITRDNLIHLDRYGKRLHAGPLPAAIKSADQLAWSARNKWFWIVRGQSLSAVSLDKDVKPRQVWLAPKPVTGMIMDHSSLFAWTPTAVGRFSDSGKTSGNTLDNIKVNPSRQLSLVSVGTGTQAYLFSDGTVEIYAGDKASRTSYQLPLPSGRDASLVQSLVLGGPDGRSQVFLLVAGKPRVFSLAKDLP